MPESKYLRTDVEGTAHLMVALARAFRDNIFATEGARQEAEFASDVLYAKFVREDAAFQQAVWAKIDDLQARGW